MRPYRKPTLVREMSILRRLRELWKRNSANAKAEKIAKDKAIREAKKKANVEANATEKAE